MGSGLWRSLVAHLTGGQGVAGSNPVSPTDMPRKDLVGPAGAFVVCGAIVVDLLSSHAPTSLL
jgi:hypothetical protein